MALFSNNVVTLTATHESNLFVFCFLTGTENQQTCDQSTLMTQHNTSKKTTKSYKWCWFTNDQKINKHVITCLLELFERDIFHELWLCGLSEVRWFCFEGKKEKFLVKFFFSNIVNVSWCVCRVKVMHKNFWSEHLQCSWTINRQWSISDSSQSV